MADSAFDDVTVEELRALGGLKWSLYPEAIGMPFSSRVAGHDGHITPPLACRSARHLPTPVQRCTAAEKSPPSCR